MVYYYQRWIIPNDMCKSIAVLSMVAPQEVQFLVPPPLSQNKKDCIWN